MKALFKFLLSAPICTPIIPIDAKMLGWESGNLDKERKTREKGDTRMKGGGAMHVQVKGGFYLFI